MTWTPPEPAYSSFMVCNKCGYTGDAVEPHKRRDGSECHYCGSKHPATYTLDQLLAVRRETIEECARIANQQMFKSDMTTEDAIRKLGEQT